LDSDYKAYRPDYSAFPEEEVPFSQLPFIFAALDLLKIKYFETTSCEADDLVSGYVSQFGSIMDIVIVSQDSDFFQLISDRVLILRYRGDRTILCTPDYIREKLGIEPSQYAAYKSLTGDHADNIRGVRNVGPKTASALMRQFGDLDSLLTHADTISKPSIRQSVLDHRARIKLNYSLICLSGKAPLPFSLSSLACSPPSLTTTQVLRSIHVLP